MSGLHASDMLAADVPAAGAQGGDAQTSGAQPATRVTNAPAILDIYEFRVLGNTVLPAADIEAALQNLLGPGKTPDDVDHARERLEALYQTRGYKTVQVIIPRQVVRDGVVELQVIEGRVGHLTVRGSRYHSLDRVKEQAPSLAEGSVPNFNDVSRDLVALNQSADSRVSPALRAGAAPGTIDVDLAVDDDLPLHGSLELNNRKSQNTSALRASALLSYNNLWQRSHSLTLSYQVAPENPDDAKVVYASYLAPLDSSPFSLLVNALKSDSNVAALGGMNVIGRGDVLGLRGVITLASTETFFSSASFGLDRKHFQQQTVLGSDRLESPITYYPFTAAYSALWRLPRSSTHADVSLVFGSRQLGSDSQDYDNNRYRAQGQQLSLRASLGHTFDFENGMQLVSRLNSQLTDQPLLTYEQITAGGADSVRGYLESETTGDYGVVGSVELRSFSLAGSGQKRAAFDDIRVYGFVDGSALDTHDALPGASSAYNLVSTGLGVSFRALNHIDGGLDLAFPLRNANVTRAGDGRVLFRVMASF